MSSKTKNTKKKDHRPQRDSLTRREALARKQVAKKIWSMSHPEKGEGRGRPTKLTEPIAVKVISYVLAGNYKTTACRAVGISTYTLRNWVARAEEWLESDQDVPADELIYIQFFNALEWAEAQAELKLMTQAVSGIPGAWQAAMTVLERKHPERWGKANERTPEIRTPGEQEAKPEVYMYAPDDPDRREQVAGILERSGALRPPEKEKVS